jgi:GT2 family glycosyltransferase
LQINPGLDHNRMQAGEMLGRDEVGESFPLVSIITPAFNRAPFLIETIESVLAQAYPHIEYIVLDDGSTDNTRQVLSGYDGRIVWESHPNMGETRTVNKGIEMAHGEIVAIVNSDDPLLPGAVGKAVPFLQEHPEALVAYPDWNYIDANSKPTGRIQVPDYDYLYMVRRHHCSVGPGAFIRKEAFALAGLRDPEFRYVGDFEFWLRLGLHGPFARIPETLATFRLHSTSASLACQGRAMAVEHIRLVEKYYSMPGLPSEVLAIRREAFAWAYYIAGITAGRDRHTARRCYACAILYHPRSILPQWKQLLFGSAPAPLARCAGRAFQVFRAVRTLARRCARFLLGRLGRRGGASTAQRRPGACR